MEIELSAAADAAWYLVWGSVSLLVAGILCACFHEAYGELVAARIRGAWRSVLCIVGGVIGLIEAVADFPSQIIHH